MKKFTSVVNTKVPVEADNKRQVEFLIHQLRGKAMSSGSRGSDWLDLEALKRDVKKYTDLILKEIQG